MSLTANQFDVLWQLRDDEWLTPMYIGGYNGSHHSGTLRALIKKGFAERKGRGFMWIRGSYRYRRTEAGREAFQADLDAGRDPYHPEDWPPPSEQHDVGPTQAGPKSDVGGTDVSEQGGS